MYLLLTSFAFIPLIHAQYSATYLPDTAPDKTEQGQIGTNRCGTGSSQQSLCQNAYLLGLDDFCLFAPPYTDGLNSTIGVTEQIEISWCMRSGYGTRLIPDGTIQAAHFVKTPDYVQITGYGDLTRINVAANDAGGELDPHGADGFGNPHGGLVFTTAFGKLQQAHEWTNFMSSTEFCFRACNDGPRAAALCQHIYDVMGCWWNMPGNYGVGFDSCLADSGEPMGVYGTSTFYQGEPVTPPPHPVPPSSQCTPVSSIKNSPASPFPSANPPPPPPSPTPPPPAPPAPPPPPPPPGTFAVAPASASHFSISIETQVSLPSLSTSFYVTGTSPTSLTATSVSPTQSNAGKPALAERLPGVMAFVIGLSTWFAI